MSIVLDALLAQAASQLSATVALSPQSVAVLLYASQYLGIRENWLDTVDRQDDEVTDEDWDTIEKLVGNLYYEVMNPMIGLIIPYINGTLPPNMLPCNYSVYQREDYPALYPLLPSFLIIDADSFHTPMLSGLTLVGTGTSPISGTVYTVGDYGGTETVTLTTDQIPPHSHSYSAPDVPLLVVAPGEVSVPSIDFLPNATGNTGGGAAHNNMMPWAAVTFGIIAL